VVALVNGDTAMTPVIRGRWETRIYLLALVGIPISIAFAFFFGDLSPLPLLVYLLGIGCALDLVYDLYQRFRWDSDWPPVLHLLSGILEGALLWTLIHNVNVPVVNPGITLEQFTMHYATTWIAIFIVLWGPMKILYPRWRFLGGRLTRNHL
jgi:hypothetical protein